MVCKQRNSELQHGRMAGEVVHSPYDPLPQLSALIYTALDHLRGIPEQAVRVELC